MKKGFTGLEQHEGEYFLMTEFPFLGELSLQCYYYSKCNVNVIILKGSWENLAVLAESMGVGPKVFKGWTPLISRKVKFSNLSVF